MNKIRNISVEKPKERINQFIMECMFSKYFEEEQEKDIVVQKEEIATPA